MAQPRVPEFFAVGRYLRPGCRTVSNNGSGSGLAPAQNILAFTTQIFSRGLGVSPPQGSFQNQSFDRLNFWCQCILISAVGILEMNILT